MPSPNHLLSGSMHWQTPPELVSLLIKFNGDYFALDPCGAPRNPVKAKTCWYLPKHDGLVLEWPAAEGGLIFVNSPYGLELPRWAQKSAESHRDQGSEVVQLCPPRMETDFFHRHLRTGAVLAFWNGYDGHSMTCFGSGKDVPVALRHSRITFVNPTTRKPVKGNNTPSMLVYWGARAARFHRFLEPFAWCVRP